jgi:hypothetical protein
MSLNDHHGPWTNDQLHRLPTLGGYTVDYLIIVIVIFKSIYLMDWVTIKKSHVMYPMFRYNMSRWEKDAQLEMLLE